MRVGGATARGVAVLGAEWTAGVVSIVAAVAPSCWSRRETCPRLRTAPRGIPNPAESLRITMVRGEACTGLATGPRFTTTFCPGLGGGCGAANRCGGFITRGNVFHPAQEFPGCQNQPPPGTNIQLPYRYGIQPHG